MAEVFVQMQSVGNGFFLDIPEGRGAESGENTVVRFQVEPLAPQETIYFDTFFDIETWVALDGGSRVKPRPTAGGPPPFHGGSTTGTIRMQMVEQNPETHTWWVVLDVAGVDPVEDFVYVDVMFFRKDGGVRAGYDIKAATR